MSAAWRRGRWRRAQQSSPALIGFLNAGAATTLKREIDAFRDGLRTLGQIEGRDLRFEYRFADGHLDRLSARSPAEAASDLAASRQGLGQAGYFEGKAGRQGGLFLFAEQPGVSGNGLAARRK